MPRGDGTGPSGKGPKTGRGLGSCPPSGTTRTNKPTRGTGVGPCGNGTPRGGGGVGRGTGGGRSR